MNNRQITTLWSSIIIEELIRQGADFFCISPGSRSTPLTAAVAGNLKARWKIFPDERSAAFFALGHARATGKPAVLICTSGTAVANYFPAVVEASMDSQPMIVLSADRPFELLECGANQTIRQENIFGSYTRWHMQLPVPSTELPPKALLSTVAYAIAKAVGSPPGPVHLNQPFREPLEPEAPDPKDPWLNPLHEWQESSEPSSRSLFAEKRPDIEALSILRGVLAKADRPLIIAGSMQRAEESEAVTELALDLQIPLYGDLSSGVRLMNTTLPWQQAFATPEFTERFKPDLVLHFGGRLIAKHPAAAIRNWSPKNYIVIRPDAERYSPDHNVTLSIERSILLTAKALKGCRSAASGINMGQAETFFRYAGEAIDGETTGTLPVTEISAARLVSTLISSSQRLFLSNSMPVRDMDSFACNIQTECVITGINRGASGIDGIISTAAGFASGGQKPVTLLIGDIAFLHDLNALALLGSMDVPLQIIVLNNNGGGIFSFLPVSACKEIFETHFATPQNYSIKSAAETFGVEYANPHTNDEFIAAYKKASTSTRSTVIEVNGTREDNLLRHRSLQAKINTLAAEHLTGL
ncbi:2-succinyl-5-enolpyruvyl-6-hydroxy-3-cyclohexene-1-carboxylic-acid synthase [Chlorobium ferrooxidans]|uniref:2-succinyl-5-enolpyruvyl-6-hydroxy-3-cyclohexene-1-carboxylate synthase n=1 Tax=Chlorobium ferrooxidans DSM 13031 TaxID=377431 RepID=Q0YUD4_9CHLB|nr:2-succinyl-5-enolpyruvyl-6-hydroxy-3-cyclohexene-1-carboxylic-acid synthase [Chlorobium ferrooxidans]EAT60095.1 2-succinyl-6-hydroxy-2,4-cyclohexadiene-1-carboxylic acid synthase/2-oxoglutarate decarboxylase [Chlorobium ferrooxidans DSM 13031]